MRSIDGIQFEIRKLPQVMEIVVEEKKKRAWALFKSRLGAIEPPVEVSTCLQDIRGGSAGSGGGYQMVKVFQELSRTKHAPRKTPVR